jgi:hypothetical protein
MTARPYLRGVEKPKTGREASPAAVDPYMALAAGVLVQAVRDLVSNHLVKQLDALVWLSTSEAQSYFSALGMSDDPLGHVNIKKLFRSRRLKKGNGRQ